MERECTHIIEKVKELYNKYGIKSITMDDVARELGISKKTLYQYVNDKTELVEKTISYELEKQFDFIECIKDDKTNAIDELFLVYKHLNEMFMNYNQSAIYDLKKYYPELYKKSLQRRREQMLKSIVDNLKKGMKEGYYRKDLKVEIIANLHILRIENMYNESYFAPEDYNSTDVFNEIFNYHIHGIANQKGINYIEEKLKKL